MRFQKQTPRPITIKGDIALIPLTQGKVATIDAADVEIVKAHIWRAVRSRNTFYAATTVRRNGKRGYVSLHILIVGEREGLTVDHRDRDGLNCRRKNLRHVTRSQNQINRGPTSRNTSGVKGVHWVKARSRWEASIRVDGKVTRLGRFKLLDDAKAVRLKAEATHHKGYAPEGDQ